MKDWKWISITCLCCGEQMQPAVGGLDSPDSLVSPYLCWACEHPDLAEAERLAWEEHDRKIDEMTARGEILDAGGNPVPSIRYRQ